MRVTLIAAQSLDGFITRHDEPGTAFTSADDKAYFSQVLQQFDCSICGSATYRESRDAMRRNLGNHSRRRVVLTRDPSAYAADVVPDRLEFSAEPPLELCERLRKSQHRECALLGGAVAHQLFLAANCVDALWITVEPRIFGRGTPLVRGPVDIALQLEAVERFPNGDTLLLKYRTHRPEHG